MDGKWWPQGDSNPCLQAENLTCWTRLHHGALRKSALPL